jgi:hypothetical protein
MGTKSKIQVGVLSSILLLSFAGADVAQAQGRQSSHTVSVRVPSVVKIVADPVALGPTGLPVLRVVTNDPTIRRRFERGAEGGMVAEALTATPGHEGGPMADYRFTAVAP